MFLDLLVAIDGSPASELALSQAIDLASAERGRRLTLLTAIPLPSPSAAVAGIDPDALQLEVAKELERALRAARDRVPDDIGVTTVMPSGAAGPAIVRQAREGRHDLVVVGSRGRGPLASALLGSVSAHVVRHCPVAVLVVHVPEDAQRAG